VLLLAAACSSSARAAATAVVLLFTRYPATVISWSTMHNAFPSQKGPYKQLLLRGHQLLLLLPEAPGVRHYASTFVNQHISTLHRTYETQARVKQAYDECQERKGATASKRLQHVCHRHIPSHVSDRSRIHAGTGQSTTAGTWGSSKGTGLSSQRQTPKRTAASVSASQFVRPLTGTKPPWRPLFRWGLAAGFRQALRDVRC
jgi:hypothetical protein